MLKYNDLAEACKRANLPLPEVGEGEEWKMQSKTETTPVGQSKRKNEDAAVNTTPITKKEPYAFSDIDVTRSVILTIKSWRPNYQQITAAISVAVIAAASHAHATGLAGACGLLGGLLTCAFKPAPTLVLALAAGAVGGMVLWG